MPRALALFGALLALAVVAACGGEDDRTQGLYVRPDSGVELDAGFPFDGGPDAGVRSREGCDHDRTICYAVAETACNTAERDCLSSGGSADSCAHIRIDCYGPRVNRCDACASECYAHTSTSALCF